MRGLREAAFGLCLVRQDECLGVWQVYYIPYICMLFVSVRWH